MQEVLAIERATENSGLHWLALLYVGVDELRDGNHAFGETEPNPQLARRNSSGILVCALM